MFKQIWSLVIILLSVQEGLTIIFVGTTIVYMFVQSVFHPYNGKLQTYKTLCVVMH
jgi:hypothetical protein